MHPAAAHRFQQFHVKYDMAHGKPWPALRLAGYHRGVKALRASSLREQAVEVIRAGIVSGELEPGTIYSAAVLAERLGVSATPVREAMLDLAGAGLVEAVRNRGFRVLAPGERDLQEIGELRLLLEVPAIARAAALATAEDLGALDALLAETGAAAADGDVSAYLVADRRLHLRLLEAGGNRRLVQLVDRLRDQTRLLGLRALADTGGLEASEREHRDIVAALAARDAGRAQELMRAHIEHTRGAWAGRSEPG
jgi:DNA-binding GntR family transcriptional regulator